MAVTKKVVDRLINFTPVTTLYSENSIVINRDGDDVITSVVVSDGITTKTFTFGYNANGRLISLSTVVTEI
jgi:hypothetical protein